MRTKLLSAILLASTALAGVASADPYVRDHRNQPTMSYYQSRARFINKRPTWMPQYNASNTTYGYQVDADGDEVTPYQQGQDPYVEGIARGEWSTLAPCLEMENHAVEVDLKNRPVQSLELQATRGSANLFYVGIIFADGTQMPIRLDRSLDPNHSPNLRIDLGSRGLNGVRFVVVEGRGYASFRMLGA